MNNIEKVLRELHRRVYKNIKHLIFFRPNIVLSKSLDYDSYWQRKKDKKSLNIINPFQLERANFIKSHIEDNQSLLDIGTGDGTILLEVMKDKKVSCYGTDISDYILNFLKTQNISSIKWDFNSDSPDILPNTDYILMLEVIEHMQDSENFVLQMLNKSRKGVFISVPNTGFFPWRIRFLFGYFPVQWLTHPGEHLRFWTYKDMKWWLKQMNLNNYTIYPYEGIPLLNKLWPSLFAQAMIIKIDKE